MRRVLFCGLAGLAVCIVLSTAVLAARNLADYPLRVHIYSHDSVSHYWGPGGARSLDGVDGEGRGNLFENGEPRGFDFRYYCGNRLMNSMGYETYPARWKKPGKEMQILLPADGGACDFKVDVKPDVVYHRRNGYLEEQPAAKYKEWMIRHQYDPEHGMNLPVDPTSVPKPAQALAGPGAQK
ncbi:MAG: hypothetical protein WAK26_08595 [Terracidiphilus sp.]|jgi:hypothetical protein